MKKFFVVLLLFAMLPGVLAALDSSTMKIYAVTTSGEGLSATLTLEIVPGTGRVWTTVEPLVGTTTQSAERTAVQVAKGYATSANNFDYKFHIESNAALVEGPSAGAAMALMSISMLKDQKIPGNVSITGTINKDGFVGSVGGVFHKAKAASEDGVALFIIPKGDAKQTAKIDDTVKSVNLLEYAPENWGMKVVEANTIDDVLIYAFSDIGEIDVNIAPDATLPDFVPDSITHPAQAAPMKGLASNYISETKQLIMDARVSLSSTMLQDDALIATLLEILNNADQTISNAELLNDQNYLYSAANYAFLAKLDAMLVKDLSDNPSLLALDSLLFESKLKELKRDIASLKEDLSEGITVDYLEYHIAAKQRLAYAENKLNELMSTQSIVIAANGNNDYPAAIRELQEYESALGWYEVARDFYHITKDSHKKTRASQVFAKYMDNFIVNSENGLTLLDGEDVQDIERRLNAARDEKENGWFLASSFDAASSLSLVNARLNAQDKDLNSLYSLLREKIDSVEAVIEGSEHSFVWGELYLAHAKYFLGSADFYYAQNRGSKTIDSLKNGISLVLLAENMVLVAEDMYLYYGSLPEDRFIATMPSGNEQAVSEAARHPLTDRFLIAVFALLLAITLALVLLIARVYRAKKFPRATIPGEIARLKSFKAELDTSFGEGKITKEAYGSLAKKCEKELSELENLRKSRTEHILEADTLKAEVTGYKNRLKDLKMLKNKGLISEQEFGRKSNEYTSKMNSLLSEIKHTSLELVVERERLLKIKSLGGTVKKLTSIVPNKGGSGKNEK